MEDAHKLLKIPKSECPDIWTRPPRHKWPKSWSSMDDPVVPLERNLYGILWQDYYGKGNLRKSYRSMAGGELQIGNVSLFIVKKDYSYQYWLERNKILIRCGKYPTKKSIWENQHLSWITYAWAALKGNVK